MRALVYCTRNKDVTLPPPRAQRIMYQVTVSVVLTADVFQFFIKTTSYQYVLIQVQAEFLGVPKYGRSCGSFVLSLFSKPPHTVYDNLGVSCAAEVVLPYALYRHVCSQPPGSRHTTPNRCRRMLNTALCFVLALGD